MKTPDSSAAAVPGPAVFLGSPESELAASGALWTAREIEQQPRMLERTHALLAGLRAQVEAFVGPVAGNPAARVILTGAGTSAYIGQCLAPLLDREVAARVDAVPTTDIVGCPRLYLDPEQPLLLVSFGRSGNSPESLAAVDLAEKLVRDVRHLVVTCNPKGGLANLDVRQALTIQLPEETRDIEVRTGPVTTQTKRLVLSAIDTYDRSREFYSTAAEGAADLELREPEDDETVALLVSDRHDNIGMDRVARAVGEAAGATVVLDAGGDVLSSAHNVRERDQDPTGHAEVVALRAAADRVGEWRLGGCTLVVTLEPCTMCAGAAVLARVERLVFGAYDEKAGAVGSLWDVVRDRRLNHRPEVIGGVLAVESARLLDRFFAAHRDFGRTDDVR